MRKAPFYFALEKNFKNFLNYVSLFGIVNVTIYMEGVYTQTIKQNDAGGSRQKTTNRQQTGRQTNRLLRADSGDCL